MVEKVVAMEALSENSVNASSCKVVKEGVNTLCVISEGKYYGKEVGWVFLIGGLVGLAVIMFRIYFHHDFDNGNYASILLALILCGLQEVMYRERVSFDLSRSEAHYALRSISSNKSRSAQIMRAGQVILWCEFVGDTESSNLFYVIELGHAPHVVFFVRGKYEKALKVAKRLAGFLSWGFRNDVPAEHRR